MCSLLGGLYVIGFVEKSTGGKLLAEIVCFSESLLLEILLYISMHVIKGVSTAEGGRGHVTTTQRNSNRVYF